MCIVDNSLLIFAQFLYLQRVCANLLSVVSLIQPTHVSKIISKNICTRRKKATVTMRRSPRQAKVSSTNETPHRNRK